MCFHSYLEPALKVNEGVEIEEHVMYGILRKDIVLEEQSLIVLQRSQKERGVLVRLRPGRSQGKEREKDTGRTSKISSDAT